MPGRFNTAWRTLLRSSISGLTISKEMPSSLADAIATAGGLWHYIRLLTSNWGVDIADTRVPAQLWYGDLDDICPATDLPDLSANHPFVRLDMIRGEGHYSLPIRHVRRILEYFM